MKEPEFRIHPFVGWLLMILWCIGFIVIADVMGWDLSWLMK